MKKICVLINETGKFDFRVLNVKKGQGTDDVIELTSGEEYMVLNDLSLKDNIKSVSKLLRELCKQDNQKVKKSIMIPAKRW